MRAFLDRMLTAVREFVGKMSRRAKILAVILALVVIVLAIVAATLLSRTNYVLLYNAQDDAEAGRIYTALTEMSVPAKVIRNTEIHVPENRAGELRAMLSSEGVIGPTTPALEILSLAANFNVTDSHAKKLYEYQRAEDIRRLILQTGRIENCVVIANIGQQSTYVRPQNTNQATAVVMLSVVGNERLTDAEAYTIGKIVKDAIPGISYENISVSDNNLNTYVIGEELVTEDPEMELDMRVMLTNLINKQVQEQALQFLTPIFGMSNVEVLTRVTLNFDKEIVESVEFEPPVAGELDGIIRSSHELWEAAKALDEAEGIVGTDPNGMGTVEYPYGSLDDNEFYEKAVRERNYEINETRTLIEREQGGIRFISIGVSLNQTAIPEGEDYTEQITDLISKGLGVSLTNVSVHQIPFNQQDTSMQTIYDQWVAYEEQLRQRELVETIIMWAVILLLGIALFTLIGVLIKGTRPIPEPETVLVEGGGIGAYDFMVDDEEMEEEEQAALPDIEDLEMNKKSTGLEQIERFIDKDPAAVAALLRNWLTEE